MSKHDPEVILRQITEYANRAQELCAQNELPGILMDWCHAAIDNALGKREF
jgi:hypothetical protein